MINALNDLSLQPVSMNRRRVLCAGAAAGMLAAAPSVAADAAEMFEARTDLDGVYDAAVDQAVRAGLELLVRRQNPDGTFATDEQGQWVGVCALAGLAWLSRGVRPGAGSAGRALERTGNYVLSKVQGSGFLSAKQASHGPMYDHGFGTLFLAELYGTTHDSQLRNKLSSAIRLIVRTQNSEGGWRYNPAPREADLSVTVCQMMALRAARNAGIGVPKKTVDNAVKYVQRSQNPDGGFMYQITGGPSRFPLTAAAVVALYNAGIYEGDEIEQAFAYLEANSRTYRSPGRDKSFFFYAHYYSVQAFWHKEGDAWSDWYAMLKRTFVAQQNEKGGWFGDNGIEYCTAMACLILNMPRTVLPIFQR